MAVRGAPLIGAAAAWGVYLSFLEHSSGKKNETGNVYNAVISDAQRLKSARPTAVNLAWAVDYMTGVMKFFPDADALSAGSGRTMCDEEAERSRLIGENGLPVIEADKQHERWRNRQYPDALQCRVAGMC
jgi:methylthioribose-1-phosphate isomerase